MYIMYIHSLNPFLLIKNGLSNEPQTVGIGNIFIVATTLK